VTGLRSARSGSMPPMALDTTAEVTGLLQELIRNACVNDGTPESGHEDRSVATLRDHLAPLGLPTQEWEPLPGRRSMLTRLEGTDPSAPTLMLMGHLDVVPVSPDSWRHDPFGGELIDGWVWGRGAIDMLNITASMGVAFRRLAESGTRMRGTLLYLVCADEEAGGAHGAQWVTDNALDEVRCDWCVTESGGVLVPTPGGNRLWTVVGEKGVHWLRLTVYGTPSHGSRPLGTDNALVKAAEVIRRLAEFRPKPLITDAWRRWVGLMGYDEDLADALTTPERIWEGISELPGTMGSAAHAATHLTCAPTVVHGGSKTNIIPDRVEIELDMRKLPGQSGADADQLLRDALGDLYDSVTVSAIEADEPSESSIETPVYLAMERAARKLRPDATLLPTLTTGGTDARYFREKGIPAYGFGLFSDAMSLTQWHEMFHGNDERVDQESLRLSTELWQHLAHEVLD
jgi:acetylornithine deacetylase/succinyl-diaminopimelate desuccinylase-like protein